MYRRDSLSNIRSLISFFALLMLALVMPVVGCGGGGGGGGSTPTHISVSVTANPTTVDGGDTVALSASVLNDTSGQGLTWSVSGGGTLSGTSGFSVTYTAPAATSSAQSVTVTATSVADGTKSGSATITVAAAPTITTSSLAAATVGTAYSVTLAASGGIAPYTWSATGLPSSLSLSSAGVLSGTPALADVGTYTVAIKLTDSGKTTALTATANLSLQVVNSALAITTTSLPAATLNQAYSATVDASGGQGPYTWKINGTTITSAPFSLGNGLSATSSGGTSLSISGTPTSTSAVSLTNVTVTDSEGTPVTAGPVTYSITVNGAGYSVSGQLSLLNACGTSPALPTITVKIQDSTFNTTTTVGSNGSYSFTNVPDGTYSVTPSISSTSGTSAVFLPALLPSVTVNGGNVTGQNFGVSLSYTVSGTVSYSGSQSGRVYVDLVGNNCGERGAGTSLTSAGAYTISGVPPGAYTVQAWLDPSTLGEGQQNDADPSGTGSVTVATANQSSVNVTLTDPSLSTPTVAPTIKGISPMDSGVIISYGGGSVTDSTTEKEIFSSYTVQWSTSATSGFSTSNQETFKATGTSTNVWIVNSSSTSFTGALTTGTTYYFRVAGSNSAGMGPWSTVSSAVTIGSPSTGNTVSGTVTIPNTVTVVAGAQLYMGYYDQSTNLVYAKQLGSPVQGANSFTVSVPSGSNYIFFGILDQNHDGLIDAGDVTNVRDNNSTPISITANTTGQTLTLPSTNSNAVVRTYYTTNGTVNNYGLALQLSEGNKLPVSVRLVAGSNVVEPIDMSNWCQSCGTSAFLYIADTGVTPPSVNDGYTFDVTYSDGSEEKTVTAKVIAVLGPSALATGLAPTGTGSGNTTPTFTWTYPSNASSYTYQFNLSDSSGNTIWQIPGYNSNSNGFTSTQIPGSLLWGVDPTDGTNMPSVGTLTSGQTYYWQITTLDSNGDSATTQVNYQP